MVSHRTGTGTEEFKLREEGDPESRVLGPSGSEDMIQFREFDKPDSDRVTEY